MTSFITPYCICAYVIYPQGNESKYLLLRRCGKYLPGTWQMVSGGIHEGEKAWQAAMREIIEETGLHPVRFYSADAVETFYNPAMDKISCAPVFVAIVDNIESLQLSPKEHDAYEWLTIEEAKELLIWSEQKRVIQHVHDNFVLHEPNRLLLIDF